MDTEFKPIRLTALSAGCFVDGVRGWHTVPYMIEIAVDYGYPITDEDRELVASYDRGESQDSESVHEIADEAEAWLNEHIAPAGYSFGWHDGDFMLWDLVSWRNTP